MNFTTIYAKVVIIEVGRLKLKKVSHNAIIKLITLYFTDSECDFTFSPSITF